MPSGSEIARHVRRIRRGSRQCAYHNVNSSRGVRQHERRARCRSRRLTRLRVTAFPSAPLTTNPTRGPGAPARHPSRINIVKSCTAWTTSVGRLTRIPRLVVRRKSFELRILSNRGNTVVDRGTMSGGQAGAALAAPGGNDGAAGAGPHPQTKAMGTAATPIARLECALAHGKTPTIFGVLDNSGTVLTRHASQAGRAGGSGRYGSDLLTVRGTAKPVKPDAQLGGIEE